MAHYIGRFNTKKEAQDAYLNGDILKPYVVAVDSGADAGIYYSSDNDPLGLLHLAKATFTTTGANQTVRILQASSQVSRNISKLIVDGSDYTITGNTTSEKSVYTFATAGEHTVFYIPTADTVSTISIALFTSVDCKTIRVSQDVTEISSAAFASNTTALTDFYGVNVSALTGFKFSNSITNIHAPKLTTVAYNSFQSCDNLNPDFISGLTSIGTNAFCGCTFTEVTVNPDIQTLGYSAFQMNSALTACHMSSAKNWSAGTINDSGLFSECISLTGFTYPDEWQASSASTTYPTFKNCSALTEVTFGTGMTSIGSGMFSVGNSSLVTIKSYAATAPALGGNDFDSITGNTGTLYVPAGSDYSTWSAALGENWTVSDTL